MGEREETRRRGSARGEMEQRSQHPSSSTHLGREPHDQRHGKDQGQQKGDPGAKSILLGLLLLSIVARLGVDVNGIVVNGGARARVVRHSGDVQTVLGGHLHGRS